jgi:hypothetical protein
MVAWLFPTVMDRGLVLVVKFDPRLRQRYGNYITTRNRYGASSIFGCQKTLIHQLEMGY